MSAGHRDSGAGRSVVGWDGIRFTVPADWNVSAVSASRSDGYLKVDSTGTMFLQVKWFDPQRERPRTLFGLVAALLKRRTQSEDSAQKVPALRDMLDKFLKDTGKRARKSGQTFQCKIKPEAEERGGERVVHNFSWTGSGYGQGKIWYCRQCRRTVIAQVVGQARDPVADTAAAIFSDMHDHPEDGWTVWGAFDLVTGIPASMRLGVHQFMSGYIKLEFLRAGQGRIVVERWGLANVARKRFTLRDWLASTVGAEAFDPEYVDASMNGHEGVLATGRVRGLRSVHAWRDALPTLRPATEYEACLWECEVTNRLYALQTWRPRTAVSMMGDLIARCECH